MSYISVMGLKTNRIFTASTKEKGVIVWDTTLRPLCVQLKNYDPEAMHYMSIYPKLKDDDRFEFTTKSGVKYIIQKFER